jgi:ketosteroid isomerase-like protein
VDKSFELIDSKQRDLLESYVYTVNNLDLNLAATIWGQSAEPSFIHPRGHERGWEDVKQSFYIDTMGLFSTRDLRLKDIVITPLSEDVAFAEFYWDFDAAFPDGTPLVTEGRETQVWKKEEGEWKILHIHYSGPATQEEGEGF